MDCEFFISYLFMTKDNNNSVISCKGDGSYSNNRLSPLFCVDCTGVSWYRVPGSTPYHVRCMSTTPLCPLSPPQTCLPWFQSSKHRSGRYKKFLGEETDILDVRDQNSREKSLDVPFDDTYVWPLGDSTVVGTRITQKDGLRKFNDGTSSDDYLRTLLFPWDRLDFPCLFISSGFVTLSCS